MDSVEENKKIPSIEKIIWQVEEEGVREDAAWGEVVTSRTKKITRGE